MRRNVTAKPPGRGAPRCPRKWVAARLGSRPGASDASTGGSGHPCRAAHAARCEDPARLRPVKDGTTMHELDLQADQRQVDAAMEAYVDWREECVSVSEA